MTTPPDLAAREEAIAERGRNVIVDAGAGTGKTTLVVQRLVRMVAPLDDAATALSLSRIAAVTFTRKAAGELRLRIREQILNEVGRAELTEVRRGRLTDALSALDVSFVGTIHSFADRLLRMRPQEAWVSPAYDVVEDTELLVHETHQRILHAAERGDLAAQVAETLAAAAEIAQQAVRDALTIGLRADSLELEFMTYFGLDALIASFVQSRDVKLDPPVPQPMDLTALRGCLTEFIAAMDGVDLKTDAARRLRALADGFQELLDEEDPVVLYAELADGLQRHASASTYEWRLKTEFAGDKHAHNTWKLLHDPGKARATSLRKDILQVLGAWLAPRLLHLRPVAIEIYEQVKRRHQVADQLDLLEKLRNLLRDDQGARAFYQGLFDHVFVDEFQDTDPLQAEVVMYLCEAKPKAERWDGVQLVPGKLTLVGDPKQSIYRFRRADIAMYARVRELVAAQGCLETSIVTNFRSCAELIDWFNDRYDGLLGKEGEGPAFDADLGTVRNRHLRAGKVRSGAAAVHEVPFGPPEGESDNAEPMRRSEGVAIAHYLRHLIEQRTEVRDPYTGQRRPARYGDIAVLALSTMNLHRLFEPLDALNIPHAARGATLFLRDELHVRFLLGLRAIADRDDGVAEAVLLAPPFFALDDRELIRARANPEADGAASVLAARALIAEMRRRRFERSPGATARDLIERTALGAAVARGPNGLQRLEHLRELCLVLEQKASEESLDYDAVTARLREWVDHPVQLDPPHPLGTDAVHIMTVHQAKGLEFPIVVMWDGQAKTNDIERKVPFRARRDGSAWSIELYGLSCELPPSSGLREEETAYRLAERKRLVYVSGTRARDLLVLPVPSNCRDAFIVDGLLKSPPPGTAHRVASHLDSQADPWWQPAPSAPPSVLAQVESDVGARWQSAATAATKPVLAPLAVSSHAQEAAVLTDDAVEAALLRPRAGRYGAVFGTTVHRALELLLSGASASAEDALARAATETGCGEHLEEARQDVERTVAALAVQRLLPADGRTIALEYPVAGNVDHQHLLLGIIDFLSAADGSVDIVDFKTDQPPVDDVRLTHATYVRQLELYAHMLTAAGVTVRRRGLLFTAETHVRWLS